MTNKLLKHTFTFLLVLILLFSCQWFAFGLTKLTVKAEQAEELCFDVEPVADTRASGYDPNLYLKDNYATYYFSNLSKNFGYNLKGSCAYIALSMMLSFYDTYWDDNIVPEQYDVTSQLNNDQIMTDVQSPGNKSDLDLIDNRNISNSDYYSNIVEKNAEEYLHLKLIKDGNEKFNYYNYNALYPCGLTTAQTITLAKYYLYDYMGYTNSQVTVESAGSTNYTTVRNFTISKLKQGIPVFLAGSNNTGGGHAVVAYDYNESTDTIYVHMGWYGSSTVIYRHNVFESMYPSLFGAFAIQFNTEHSHTENYECRINSEYLETDCPCELSYHPAHINVVDNNIFVKEICATGTSSWYFAHADAEYGAMLIELDLNTWLAENNALPSSIKEIYLVIPGKIKVSSSIESVFDITTKTTVDIVSQGQRANLNYITFAPNLNSHNKVRILVTTKTVAYLQSYSAFGMYFRVTAS